jgi:hypothetical protein
LDPGCIPETGQAIPISQAPTILKAHNCAILRRKLPAKRPQKPANARENLVNLYNFGSLQLNTNQLGRAALYFESNR